MTTGHRLPSEQLLAEIRLILAPELRCAECDRVGQCDEHFELLQALCAFSDGPVRDRVDAVLNLP